jgi:hypothetical protein
MYPYSVLCIASSIILQSYSYEWFQCCVNGEFGHSTPLDEEREMERFLQDTGKYRKDEEFRPLRLVLVSW